MRVWLGFSSGLGGLARELCIPLIGGDTTGASDPQRASGGTYSRSAITEVRAQPGDRILVSGCQGRCSGFGTGNGGLCTVKRFERESPEIFVAEVQSATAAL